MDVGIDCDEEGKDGDPVINFGVLFKDGDRKKILFTHLLGSTVIIERISWKTLIKPNFKKAVYNLFILY